MSDIVKTKTVIIAMNTCCCFFNSCSCWSWFQETVKLIWSFSDIGLHVTLDPDWVFPPKMQHYTPFSSSFDSSDTRPEILQHYFLNGRGWESGVSDLWAAVLSLYVHVAVFPSPVCYFRWLASHWAAGSVTIKDLKHKTWDDKIWSIVTVQLNPVLPSFLLCG